MKAIQPAWAYVYSCIQRSNTTTVQDLSQTFGLRPEVAQDAVKNLITQGVVQDNGGTLSIANNADQSLVQQLTTFFTTREAATA